MCVWGPVIDCARAQDMAARRVALEGMDGDPALAAGGAFAGRPGALGLSRFVFKRCSKCALPFFAGAVDCVPAGAGAEEAKGGEAPAAARAAAVSAQQCPACALPEGEKECAKHGKSEMLWKVGVGWVSVCVCVCGGGGGGGGAANIMAPRACAVPLLLQTRDIRVLRVHARVRLLPRLQAAAEWAGAAARSRPWRAPLGVIILLIFGTRCPSVGVVLVS